jgi:Saxitoxin biosynthesis operon protein SxtJ
VLIEVNWSPSKRELRNFGLTMLVAFPCFGAILGLIKHSFAPLMVCLPLGVVFAVCAILLPPVGRLLYKGWMGIGVVMGIVVAPVLLSLIYYLVFTPIGLGLRLMGKDPMGRRRAPGSYWHPVEHRTTVRSYERQF